MSLNLENSLALMGRDPKGCMYCGRTHEVICPAIKALDFDAEGNVLRVELKIASDYPASPQLSAQFYQQQQGGPYTPFGGFP